MVEYGCLTEEEVWETSCKVAGKLAILGNSGEATYCRPVVPGGAESDSLLCELTFELLCPDRYVVVTSPTDINATLESTCFVFVVVASDRPG